MRSKVVRTLALALVLGGIGIALGQQPASKEKAPPTKSKLEEMLAEALKNNPDIRVAAAKLAEADAELYRTRIQVTQKVVTLHHAIHSQKATVDYTQKKYDRYKGLLDNRAIDVKLVDEVFAELTAVKAKLAELEAQMPAVLGKSPQAEEELVQTDLTWDAEHLSSLLHYQFRQRRVPIRAKVDGPLAERMRKALQTPVKVDYKDMTVTDVLKDLEKKAPGLSIRDFPRKEDIKVHLRKVHLQFEEALPVSGILQALEDYYNMCFFVRDYGILVSISRNTPPPGALTVGEFLRQKPAEK